MLSAGNHWVRFWLAIGMALALAGGLAGSALALNEAEGAAVEIRGGDTVTIAKEEVVDDDLFISAGSVVVDGTVNGDLFVTGGQAEINGVVNGSLAFGGQSLTLNGQVAGSVYAGGASVTLGPQASVGRNVYFGGFSLEAESGSVIGRDVLMGGYQALLGGEVGRDVRAGLGALQLEGTVGGDVAVDVGEPGGDGQAPPSFFVFPGMPAAVAPGMRIGPEASIGGKLTYTSPVVQAEAIQSLPAGGVVYQTPRPGERPEADGGSIVIRVGRWVWARARELITLLVLGALAVWKLPTLLNSVIEQARTRPLPAAGWGLLAVIVGYVGAGVLALVTVLLALAFGVIALGGLAGSVFGVGFSSLGLAFTIFSLLVSYGSKLVIAFLVGRLVLQRLAPQSADHKVWPLLTGVALYVLIRSIPLLGWLVGVAATLVGLGAMWLMFRGWRAQVAAAAGTNLQTVS